MFSEDRPQKNPSPSATIRDQRKHIRMEHSGSVQLVGEGKRFTGQAVNISRTGMQVVVNLPDSYESVRSITFTLPNTEHMIELPCHIVRSETKDGNAHGGILGLEFSYQGEAQLLLIENYIRDLKNRELAQAPQSSEMRQIPRADCSIRNISVNKPGVRVVSIDNISTEGLLISFEGRLEPSEEIELECQLPLDTRKMRLRGHVAYVIGNSFNSLSIAGIYLLCLRETDRARIRNLLVSTASSSAMRNLHTRLLASELDQRYVIKDRRRITHLLCALQQEKAQLNALFEDCLKIVELRIQRVDESNETFHSFVLADPSELDSSESKSVYMSFYLNRGSYYFKCRCYGARGREWNLSFPDIIFQSEKRSYARKVLEIATDVEVYLDRAFSEQRKLSGRLIDISRRGFLCEIFNLDGRELALEQGQLLHYTLEESLGLDSHGVIRHIENTTGEDGTRKILLGIEAGIRRQVYQFRYFSADEWSNEVQRTESNQKTHRSETECVPVHYYNNRGQHLSALINATRFGIKAPVVVMPPAFGKKKEALSPLVVTLLANFRFHQKEIVTVRYDGINRPGESHNDIKKPKRGYEMLEYRLEQGQEDLRSTLDYVYDNPYFTPEKVILVTFSMSSLDARRLISSGEYRRVDLWISCMGIPAAQSSYGKILGGVDIVGNYKLNIPNGIGGVLGHLINLDTLAQDLIVNKYAYITDARQDMSKIPTPVLWIYGSYDRWLIAEEIKDIMSVKSPSTREVIEIPTGHNLRCSDDAITTFKVISSYLFEHIHGASFVPVNPDKEEILHNIVYERERLDLSTKIFKPEEYWKNYLIGQGTSSSGYDFYSNFTEFRKFLDTEAQLISPQPGDRIADMGCGTGLFLDSLLRWIGEKYMSCGPIDILAVDLVEEALAKARSKYERFISTHPELTSIRTRFKRMDLEPNRLLPVYTFVNNPHLDFNYLRNRVEGLRNVTIDFLNRHACRELAEIMRGREIDEQTTKILDKTLYDGHRSAVLDFNRAARFLLNRLQPEDILPGFLEKHPDPGSPCFSANQGKLTANHLRFDVLSFGKSDSARPMEFKAGSFTKIVASLFISYLFDPEGMVDEFYEILAPGGLLLVSSMKPDSDVSTMYTEYIDYVMNRSGDGRNVAKEQDLSAARAMLNEAASLFTLEEEGTFRFYSSSDLVDLLKAAGFEKIQVHPTMGHPPQAIIATAYKPQ